MTGATACAGVDSGSGVVVGLGLGLEPELGSGIGIDAIASGWQNASNKTNLVKKILGANLLIFISLLYKNW
jgi:hypothetical protein